MNGIRDELLELLAKYANNAELLHEIYMVKKIAGAIEYKINENKKEKDTHYKKGININYYKIIKNILKLFKRETYTMVMTGKSNDRVSHFDKLSLTERLFGTKLT